MFTDEEIRTAMQGLVDEKGGEHTAAATYSYNGETGTCFLGALCEFMGQKIPVYGTSARNILGVTGASPLMQEAFHLAQYLNDRGFEWKYILKAVDMFMSMGPDAYFASELVAHKIHVLRQDDRNKLISERFKELSEVATEASDAISTYAGTMAVGGIVSDGEAVMMDASGAICGTGTFLGSLPVPSYVYVNQKKDHALVA